MGEFMKYWSTLLLLNTLIISSCSTPSYRSPSSDNKILYHGLESMSLDPIVEWTEGLYAGIQSNKNFEKLSLANSIYGSFKSTNNLGDFMAQILNLKLHNKYTTEKSYREIAEGLLLARKKIRRDLRINAKYAKESMVLLELLAEETLYVDSLRFKGKDIIRFDYTNDTNACGKKSAILNQTKICQGDIILSKGETGSSSFLARIADYPGNFSHSTTPYIDAHKRIFMVEAFIEDGVKLRDPAAEYIKSPRTKLMIYRNSRPSVVREAVSAIDMIVNQMAINLNGKDATTNSSFEYDFNMDATKFDRLFCSEVSHYAYSLNTAIPADQNPYPKSTWSTVEDPTRNLLLSQFLEANTNYPAPSDVELNPNFEIISLQFNPAKLSSDRMAIALIDVLMQIMNENNQSVTKSINSLGKLGSAIVDPKVIRRKLEILKRLGIKLPPNSDAIIDSFPKNINYKQLLFFAFLNERLTPKVLAQLSSQEQQSLANGKVLDLETMRSSIKVVVESELKEFAQIAVQAMK
jgi:hypothetical protein